MRRLSIPASFQKILLASLLAVLCGADKAPTTQPSTQPAAALTGTVISKDRITRIAAVDREWADVLKTSEQKPKDEFLYDAALGGKGEFRVDHLLSKRPYDLLVWTTAADGTTTRWEGVSMDFHRPVTPSTPATPDDRKSIEWAVKDPPEFYDKVRPLFIAADHQHATVLVELIRTRDFHNDKGGEVVYRAELWYFENLFGGWAKDANTERVIVRVRGKPKDLEQNWQFVPALGGLPAVGETATVPASVPTSGPATAKNELTLPDKPDPRHGVVGGIK